VKDSGNTVLDRLALFAEKLDFSALPGELVQKACDCFFDFAGCYFGALKYLDDPAFPAKLAAINPSPDVTVWGLGIQCGVAEAALLTGCLGYELEYDDGVSLAGHWGSASIPAAYFSNVMHNGNGKTLICAIVAAYETGTRISRFFSPRLLNRSVHFPCVMGAFAAVTAYGKAAGLDAGVIAGALSLAGLFPQGTYSTGISGAGGKSLYSGWPNYLGINAVRFSLLNLRGDSGVLEDPCGFAAALGLPPPGAADCNAMLDGLGRRFSIMETYFKPYPCNRWFHAPVAALLALREQYGFSPGSVREITVYGPSFLAMYNTHEGFDAKTACQYSLPYTLGAALIAGKLTLEEYGVSMRSRKDLGELVSRIQVRPGADKAPSPYSVEVEAVLQNGQKCTACRTQPWSPESPPSRDELIEKFRYLTASVLPDSAVEKWISCYKSGFYNDDVYKTLTDLLKERV
jgi:2-methylcitrate dehydratase PrpD